MRYGWKDKYLLKKISAERLFLMIDEVSAQALEEQKQQMRNHALNAWLQSGSEMSYSDFLAKIGLHPEHIADEDINVDEAKERGLAILKSLKSN